LKGALFLLSGALLAHELALLRALSIASWHHAASLIVSVALLAFGAAGTLLALLPPLRRPSAVAVASALFALSIPLSLAAAGAVDFNVLEVGWDRTQWLRLLALEGIFLVPFLLGALGISVALALAAQDPGRTYAANLLGSAAGSFAGPLLLSGAPPERAMLFAALACAGAAALAARGRLRAIAIPAAAAALLSGPPRLPMSPYKDLPSAPGVRILETRFGPLGRVDRAAAQGLHVAPGLSLLAEHPPRQREALFSDGHLVAAIEQDPPLHLAESLGELAFLLAPERPSILLLGVGPGLGRAAEVVETDPLLLRASGARGTAAEPRAFLERTERSWDLLLHHLPPLHAATETPLLTVEGLRAALARTTPGGAVALECELASPPRAALRLLLTAERTGASIVAARSADRLLVLLRRRPLDDAEKARLLGFCDRWGFDPVRPRELRPASPRHESAIPLEDPGPGYAYDVAPRSDARPYFFQFFRWSGLREILDREKTPFVQWPFVALLVAFAQVTALGALLLLLPLLLVRASRAPALRFAALGAGFMLLEMAFFQRAMTRMGSPVHAAAAVFGGFLCGAGAGSLLAGRTRVSPRIAALRVLLLAPPGFLLLPGSPLPAALVCAAVALPMGFPFPLSLRALPAPGVAWALA